jgi:pyruvate formate lyase activating enzyme
VPEGGVGYCGLVRNAGGRLARPGGGVSIGVLTYYYDPIPTSYVADWVWPASTGRGYSQYAKTPWGEVGYYILAVFYGACSPDFSARTGCTGSTPPGRGLCLWRSWRPPWAGG